MPVIRILRRTRAEALSRRVRFTQKAIREIAQLPFEFDERDACDVLAGLRPRDFDSRIPAVQTGEDLDVFKPLVLSLRLYVKLLLRDRCVVISFHEDEPDAPTKIPK